VVATWAPSARPTWIAWVPIPPDPPCTSSSSPAASPAWRTTVDHTVQATSGTPPAITTSTPGGNGIT
jgi:hypothetical protein